jgi:hypothetical protein
VIFRLDHLHPLHKKKSSWLELLAALTANIFNDVRIVTFCVFKHHVPQHTSGVGDNLADYHAHPLITKLNLGIRRGPKFSGIKYYYACGYKLGVMFLVVSSSTCTGSASLCT